MSELATKSDFIELEQIIERQTHILTVRLGALMVLCAGFVVMLKLLA